MNHAPTTSTAPSGHPRAERIPNWATNGLTLLMVVLLATQIAWWGWHFLTPRLSAGAGEASTEAVEVIDASLARNLLGAASSSAAPAVAASEFRLKGVFAVDGRTLSAVVINAGGRDLSVRVNESIADGVRLVEVHRDHAIISRSGTRERIELERLGSGTGKVTVATTNTGNPSAANAAGSGFRLNVSSGGRNTFSLSRTELNNVLKDPNQINYLGQIVQAPGSGVQIQDAPSGSLVNKLGLQVGDIIIALNGQPINGPGDLARLYGVFGTTNSVRAEIRRGGTPMVLNYNIAN
jgi:general secretion pathway protein C